MDQLSLFAPVPGVGDWVETHGRARAYEISESEAMDHGQL